ncbi:hypothetical protein ACH40F_12035 [Streptomyces sp. NPDC020794]|uniref:hypothetical protein n=1 Tax=unclassified Streptomyces TaxID=2593676 RepID=UPI0036EF1883
MNRQLTVQEFRHRLARGVCHGRRGQIMQAYRDVFLAGRHRDLAMMGMPANEFDQRHAMGEP